MRVTNNMLIHNMLWNMNNNLVSMSEKQNQLSTGKRISKPSDDPVGITQIIKVKSDIVENEQYKDNTRDAKSWLEVSENSINDIKSILQRIRELAVQAANGTNTSSEAEKAAKEVEELTKEIIVNANSTIAGRYLFSGFQTDTKLLNDDGTYNVDITSEKLSDFVSIAYEVAVGESIQVGTNYLDVFGIVEEKNVLIDTFVFGDVSNGESRIGNDVGTAATHTKIQGPVDFTKDLTGETLEIIVNTDGTPITYTVDTSTLNGQIEQKDFTKALLDAKQTSPAAAYPEPTLSSVAEVYFVKSKDPNNTSGELVIEAKAFGASTITFNAMGTALSVNPVKTSGTDVVAGSQAIFQGTFDYSTNYSFPPSMLAFKVGGKNYYATTSAMNGTINEADFIDVINNAKSAEGQLLSDVATVSFDSLGGVGSIGVLSLEAKESQNETITVIDEADGFKNPITQTGKDAVAAQIQGPFSATKDLTGENLLFTIGSKRYSVNTATMNGTLTAGEIQTLIENAPDGSGGKLSDVMTVAYDGTTLTLTAITAKDESVSYTDSGGGFTSAPTLIDGVAEVTAHLEGTFDISTDMTAVPLTYSFNGTTYTVDTSTMDGTLTPAAFISLLENAPGVPAGQLGDVANISFNALSGTVGNLSIIAKNPGAGTFTPSSTTGFIQETVATPGIAFKEATKATHEGIVDFSTDLTVPPPGVNKTLEYVFDGVTYNVDTSAMNGSISESDFINLIRNADDGGGNKLGDVTDVNFTSHGSDGTIGTLKIEAKVAGNKTIEEQGTGDIYVNYPVSTTGVDAEDAEVTGTVGITDAMISGESRGIGTQSFVVTYNGETERIDIDMTAITNKAELETAINTKLGDVFGQSGSPLENNVKMDIVPDGAIEVVKFIGKSQNDGSRSELKVDVIVSNKSKLIQDLQDFTKAAEVKDDVGIDKFLEDVDVHLDHVLSTMAEMGAMNNRLDFIEKRIESNNLSMTQMLSDVQDIDYSETILKFKSLEAIYRASLSTGAKVIQPTLVDFIK